jgi:chemotaxis protein MotB
MTIFKNNRYRAKVQTSIEDDDFFISWGDMVTLLLVFFIYLFSISEINVIDFLKASKSIKKDIGLSVDETILDEIELEQKKFKEMKMEINNFISEKKIEDVLSVEHKKNRLELNLGDTLLFTSGASDLKKQGQNVLSQLSSLFKTTNCHIIVEGYTDNAPINTTRFSSNWELSAGRAASVVEYLQQKSIPGERFRIIGLGEFNPLVPNTSNENRAKNRRVRIILKPKIEKS